MKQHNIPVEKTARYFTSGTAGEHTRDVWFLVHGYGQLANYFLRNFEPLLDNSTLLVAPEGLHRFYTNGFSGRIGASWMTREDRLDDIRDYIKALDTIYDDVLKTVPANVRVHVLGFSQGSATTSRWIAGSARRFDTLTLWCGFFPPDMEWTTGRAKFDPLQTVIVTASEDEFITPAQEEEQLNSFRAAGIRFGHLRFEGKHVIDADTLLQLKSQLVPRLA